MGQCKNVSTSGWQRFRCIKLFATSPWSKWKVACIVVGLSSLEVRWHVSSHLWPLMSHAVAGSSVMDIPEEGILGVILYQWKCFVKQRETKLCNHKALKDVSSFYSWDKLVDGSINIFLKSKMLMIFLFFSTQVKTVRHWFKASWKGTINHYWTQCVEEATQTKAPQIHWTEGQGGKIFHNLICTGSTSQWKIWRNKHTQLLYERC